MKDKNIFHTVWIRNSASLESVSFRAFRIRILPSTVSAKWEKDLLLQYCRHLESFWEKSGIRILNPEVRIRVSGSRTVSERYGFGTLVLGFKICLHEFYSIINLVDETDIHKMMTQTGWSLKKIKPAGNDNRNAHNENNVLATCYPLLCKLFRIIFTEIYYCLGSGCCVNIWFAYFQQRQ